MEQNVGWAHGAVLVEFLGLPGAGKSTLADGVIRLLRQRGVPVRGEPVHEPANVRFPGYRRQVRRLRVFLRCIRFIVQNPGYSVRAASTILASGQPSAKTLAKSFISWFNVSALVQGSAHASGIYVMDQGIFQAVWSVGFGGGRPDPIGMVNRLGGELPTPHLAVAVEASLPTVERRLASRPVLSRLQEQVEGSAQPDPQRMARALALYEAIKKAAMTVAEQRETMRLLVVDNDQDNDIDVNASRITGLVESMWSQGQAT